MLAFVIRRLTNALGVMLAVACFAFLIFRFVGDPVEMMLPEQATQEQRDELRERLGLDRGFVVQLGKFLAAAAVGDFGISFRNQREVWELIAERFPATLELVIVATVLSLVIGIPLGVLTAIRRNSPLSQALQFVSILGVSLPSFVVGILLILVFSVQLGWLPAFGRGEVVSIGGWTTGLLTPSGRAALVLPSMTLALFQITLVMRLVRAEMLEVLRTDFIKFARARGLPDRIVHFRHALKNCLMPVITVTGLQIGNLIAFALITETVFQWPGMGFLFIQAVMFVDIPVMAAYLIIVSFIFVFLNTVVDLTYGLVDPRLRGQATMEAAVATEPMGLAARRPGALARALDSDLWWSLRRQPLALGAIVVMLAIVLAAALAPWIAPQNPFDIAQLDLMDSELPPAWSQGGDGRYLIGTDNQGRDVLSAILYGSRISLVIGLMTVAVSMTVGLALGLTAGFFGGLVDSIIMRIGDTLLSIPNLLVAILVAAVFRELLPPGLREAFSAVVLVMSISLTSWVQYARTVRASTMVERGKDYVSAARLIGVSPYRIMLGHILPNTMTPILVTATLNLGLAILTEATLSFLGVGMPATEPSLGTLIRIGNQYLFSGLWWVVVFPAAMLALIVLAVNLIGDWLRDALNPKLR